MSSEIPKEQKSVVESKSSMEILSELFSTFDADPPIIVKKEKDETSKKHKKSKKKHKHKDKKHKKKSKKHKRASSESSNSSSSSAIDLTDILIKTENGEDNKALLKETLQKIIKIENLIDSKKENKTSLTVDDLSSVLLENKKTEEDEVKKKCHKRKKHKYEEERSSKKSKSHRSGSKEKVDKRDYTPERKLDYKRRRSREISREKEDYKRKLGDLREKIDSKYREEKYRDEYRSRDEYKNRDEYKSKDDYKYRDEYKSRDEYRSKDEYKYKEDYKHKDDYKYRDYKFRDDYRSYDEDKRTKYRDNPFYRERSEDRFLERSRYIDRERDKFRDDENYIDKKKLLEIARRNAIQMMKSGSLPGALTLGPQAQEKVIAAIRSGGKTVEELTDFCKTLSRKEELGELSSVSEDNSSDSDGDQPFHHPFQIKDKPLTINIKNSVPLPLKTNQERASELRIQFPVSSGQQHRKTESEWIPVPPKPAEAASVPAPKAIPVPTSPPAPLAIEAPPPVPPATNPVPAIPPPGPQVFPPTNIDATKQENIDIAMIVSQRLTAMRKLQENPNDVQAITEMYKAQKEMNTWAESKQQIGQFTGSTGAQILSQAELSSGYQAWARKDQLQTAAPVSGGMGMHLLQKMGWKPGEGLGKEKTGTLEPLLLEVKLDKKGIVAKEEQKKKAAKAQKQTVKTLQGKHPVSLLGEYASKRKLGAPQYTVDFECGPDHKKNFLFKVILNGVEYKPNVASGNKKEAKALAATICLQQLGLLP